MALPLSRCFVKNVIRYNVEQWMDNVKTSSTSLTTSMFKCQTLRANHTTVDTRETTTTGGGGGGGGGCPFHHHHHHQHRRPSDQITIPSSSSSSSSTKMATSNYNTIPSPQGLPIIGTLWDLIKSGAMSKLHLYCNQRHQQLGPIYREKLGVVEGVFVADSQLIQQVYMNEGKYPQHLVPEPWIIYNEMTGNQRGLFFMEGPTWSERRKSLNEVFLKNKNMPDYSDAFNDIISDVLKVWETKSSQDGILVGLEKELYKWSIESLGAMIFGRRMGCLSEDGPQDIHTFVNCVQQIFMESAKMTMIPPKLAYKLNLPVWKRFVKAVSTALDLARSYVDSTVQEVVSRAEKGEQMDGILAQLLLKEKISKEELERIVTDLFVAAADTTSHATQWALYLLGKNSDWQEKILSEISSVVPNGEMVNHQHLASLPLVKAIVKESLRMYPVAPFLTRIITDDLTLNGFHVPAGKLVLMSLYTTGRDPKYFKDPDQFNPARWLRNPNSREAVGTHACLPFGLGARSCIGRRVAEVQMYLLLARTVQNFKLEVANEKDVEIKLRMITTPSEDIRLRLTKRVR